MMLVGAKGNTAHQLYKLLRIPSPQSASNSNENSRRVTSKTSSDRSTSQSKLSDLSTSSSSNGLATDSLKISSLLPCGSSGGKPTIRCSRKDKHANRAAHRPIISGSKSQSQRSSEKGMVMRRRLTPDGFGDMRHKEFLMLTEQLIHGNHDFVHLASFIYLDKGTKRTERFKAILRDYYETKPKKIDFDNVDLMVKTVNEDVKRTTENIYNDLLSKQEAQKLEKSYMLLVNAVFFRGFWLSNFTEVRKAPFVKYAPPSGSLKSAIPESSLAGLTAATASMKLAEPGLNLPPNSPTPSASSGSSTSFNNKSQQSDQKSVKAGTPISFEVNMMSKLDYLPVVTDDVLDARIIKMPFEASDLQMLIVLPNNKQSDSTYLTEKLSAARINHIVQQFSDAKSKVVHVSMPIFCIDSGKISIQSTLITLGAGDLFDKSKADMSGVCENKPIWLHKILHRCFIICDNRGSITSSNFEKAQRRQARIEKGVATNRISVEEFVADHPFMYIIIDSVTKTILIIGLYTDPSETIEIIHENQLSPEEAHQIYTEGVYKT